MGVGSLNSRPNFLKKLLVRHVSHAISLDNQHTRIVPLLPKDDGLLDDLLQADASLDGDGQDLLAVDEGEPVVEAADVLPHIRLRGMAREEVPGAEGVWRVVRVVGALGGPAVETDALEDAGGDFVHEDVRFCYGEGAHVVPSLVARWADGVHDSADLGAVLLLVSPGGGEARGHLPAVVSDEVDTLAH